MSGAGVRSTVLVTCFQPFDGQTVNASRAAVEALAAAWEGPAGLVTLELPVTFRGARQALQGGIEAHRPDVVVCVGEAGGRSAVGLERLAVNVIDARIPDNEGSAPRDEPVIVGGPAAFFSTLPLAACAEAVAQAGVPVEVSNTAGTFVCNATFYALMHLLARSPVVVGGFVHVPRMPEQVGPGEPALASRRAALALGAIVRATAGSHDAPRAPAPGPVTRVATGKDS